MPVTTPAAPPDVRGAHWRSVAEELREYAGQWRTVVPKASSSDAARTLARDITAGNRAAFRPAGHYRGSATGLEVRAIYVHGAPTPPI